MRWVPALFLLAGCSAPVSPSADTGARDTAKRFYSAVVAKDWDAAFALVAQDPKRRLARDQFVRLASDQRKGFGFEPDTVVIHTCDEHGPEAVAHIVISGKGSGRHKFKDALTLHSGSGAWRVVLPTSFGHLNRQ